MFKRTKKKLEEKIKQKTRLEEIKTNVVKLVFSLFRFIVLLFQLFYFSKSTSKETRNNTDNNVNNLKDEFLYSVKIFETFFFKVYEDHRVTRLACEGFKKREVKIQKLDLFKTS